ncbi:MAG: hypothetical protein RMZ42_07255 [Nostoc sp. DedQUE05]|uniref:hypothetical protein n=1 Tax=Nostoc sp. DedQUE05 TaxID=3075391 RepID=UPI002AD28DA6|nr:hypothetical protein [Nostoc sp. DedQUE05]MDZ8091724.1 hypothetical protein [Nostoc sp. DedQUE05]
MFDQNLLDESDIDTLIDLLLRSQQSRAREALCLSIGIDPKRLSFIRGSSDSDFFLLLIRYLNQIGDQKALCKVCCKELVPIFHQGIYGFFLNEIAEKLNCSQEFRQNYPNNKQQTVPLSSSAPQTISSQTAQQHLEAQSLGRKDEIIIDLINKLFDALCSPNVEVGIQKFQAIAHKSLFPNGQIDPAFRKNNFSVAFRRENLYKRPIEIIDSRSTERTRLGLRGADKEDGKEEIYAIARNDNLKGLYHVRIFFPADSRAAKISSLSL